MGTKLNKVPRTEKELNKLLQDIYVTTKKNYENDKESNFTGILEIIASEPAKQIKLLTIFESSSPKTTIYDGTPCAMKAARTV